MNVLLMKSYWPYPYSKGEHTYNRIWPPISLANCGALLEAGGHKVKILDAHALRIKPEKIKNYVRGFDKVFITSSSLDRWQCPNVNISSFLETVRFIREVTDEIYILGYHGTVDPESILKKTRAKAVVRREPERIVSEICENKNMYNIRGISYILNGRVISNPDAPYLDLRNIPCPAYHLLDSNRYVYEILGKDFTVFETGRGCKHACKFCNKIMYGANFRTKSKEQIIMEISTAVEKHGVKRGYFIDLDFLSDKRMAFEICDYLINERYHFSWCCQTRPDALNLNILNKMKQAGCNLIHLGVESGLQKFVDISGKNLKLANVEQSVRMCEEVGIKTLAFYIFGFNGETAKDRERIFDFAKKLNTDYVSFHKIYPYEENDIFMPNLKDDKSLDKFLCKKFFKYYMRWSYFRKLDMSVVFRGLKLFLGRIITLYHE